MHILENCKQLQAKHNNAVGGLLDQTLYFWRPVRSQKKNRTYYQHKKASKLAKNQRNMQITQQIRQIIHLLWLDADDKSKVF